MHRLLRLIDLLCVVLGVLSGLALTGLAGFTVVNVVLRYIFNKPIQGSNEVVQLTLVVMTCLAFAYTGRSHGHIVVDLVPDWPSRAMNAVRDALVRILTAIVFGLLAWQGWLSAQEKAFLGENSNMLEVPLTYFYYVLSVGAAVYAVALIVETAFLVTGRPVPKLNTGLEDHDVVQS